MVYYWSQLNQTSNKTKKVITMKGAREYSGLGISGVHGRLYIVQGEHARGKTMMIYVLPSDFKVRDDSGKPSLESAVVVYDMVSGQRGWTEQYGWVREGKWVDDFNSIVTLAKERKAKLHEENELSKISNDNAKVSREAGILSS